MHEGGLCEGVLAVVLDAAGNEPVRRVKLQIGALQRVVAESFDFYWQMGAAGTPAATATVDITEVPARARCRACGVENELLDDLLPLCPICSGSDIEMLSGDKVAIEAIELESGEVLRNPNFTEVREDAAHTHG